MKPPNKIGMPATLFLHQFGDLIWDAFGHIPYHVGSSLEKGDWRDVDIRLLLPDDEYKAMFGDGDSHLSRKWCAYTAAFSVLGQQMTGLPIDFQIQSVTEANTKYPGPRSAIGIVWHRFHNPEDK